MHASYDDDDRPDWEKAIHPRFTAAEDVDDEGARPSSLIPVYQRSTPDRLHDLNLLRMTQFANERTMREFGPLPQNRLSITQKRRPTVPYRDFLGREVRDEANTEESNEMKLSQLAAAAALTAGLMTGCADPKNPALNPHPKQRYEITLSIEGAPGPFESVTAFASYEIANPSECAPRDPISGVYATAGYDTNVVFHPIDNNTYRGTIYLDLPIDANYYLLGRCRWQFVSINVIPKNNGVTFSTGLVLNEVLAQKTVTTYSQKRFYFGSSLTDFDAGGDYMSDEIAAHRDNYFVITITAKESSRD